MSSLNAFHYHRLRVALPMIIAANLCAMLPLLNLSQDPLLQVQTIGPLTMFQPLLALALPLFATGCGLCLSAAKSPSARREAWIALAAAMASWILHLIQSNTADSILHDFSALGFYMLGMLVFSWFVMGVGQTLEVLARQIRYLLGLLPPLLILTLIEFYIAWRDHDGLFFASNMYRAWFGVFLGVSCIQLFFLARAVNYQARRETADC